MELIEFKALTKAKMIEEYKKLLKKLDKLQKDLEKEGEQNKGLVDELQDLEESSGKVAYDTMTETALVEQLKKDLASEHSRTHRLKAKLRKARKNR